MSNEDFESGRELKRAAEYVKATRVLAARRGRAVNEDDPEYRAHATRLAQAGVDPGAPDEAAHPFFYRQTKFYPVTDKATATKRLAELQARRSRAAGRGER